MYEGDVGILSFAAECVIGWMFMAAHIVGSHQLIPCTDTQLGNVRVALMAAASTVASLWWLLLLLCQQRHSFEFGVGCWPVAEQHMGVEDGGATRCWGCF